MTQEYEALQEKYFGAVGMDFAAEDRGHFVDLEVKPYNPNHLVLYLHTYLHVLHSVLPQRLQARLLVDCWCSLALAVPSALPASPLLPAIVPYLLFCCVDCLDTTAEGGCQLMSNLTHLQICD